MQLKRGLYKLLDRKRFTLAKYEEFLESISVHPTLPLNEFRNFRSDKQSVIGLRFDVDSNFEATMNMCRLTYQYGITCTVFILHTAKYFNNSIIPDLLKLQNAGFEIGLHQDCMSSFSPTGEMHRALRALRKEGINIYGTSAHGDKAHKNIHFWDIRTKSQFDIEYEAYELDHTKYFSDCTFINSHRWHPLDLPELKAGDRVQILIHPEHYR